MGGGLIRSAGVWSELKEARHKGILIKSDVLLLKIKKEEKNQDSISISISRKNGWRNASTSPRLQWNKTSLKIKQLIQRPLLLPKAKKTSNKHSRRSSPYDGKRYRREQDIPE
jgi:hypothetical protein